MNITKKKGIKESSKKGFWVEEYLFEVQGDSTNLGSPKLSREMREERESGIFSGKSFYIHGRPNNPPKETVELLIEAGGGELVASFDDSLKSEKNLFLICLSTSLKKGAAEKLYEKWDRPLLKFEWILDCASFFQLLPLEKYALYKLYKPEDENQDEESEQVEEEGEEVEEEMQDSEEKEVEKGEGEEEEFKEEEKSEKKYKKRKAEEIEESEPSKEKTKKKVQLNSKNQEETKIKKTKKEEREKELEEKSEEKKTQEEGKERRQKRREKWRKRKERTKDNFGKERKEERAKENL